MDKEHHIKYWLDSSEEDWISANETRKSPS
jgi:hypothetical protein